MTAVIALGIGIGAALAGLDVATPVDGTVVLGLYALALAGIGLAVGGVDQHRRSPPRSSRRSSS